MAGKAASAVPAGSLHVERSKVDPSGFYWAAQFRWERTGIVACKVRHA
jgi:hypothetical protein